MQSAYLIPCDTPLDPELAAIGEEEPQPAITAAHVTAESTISSLMP
jgi:hypothetical protein